MPRLNRYWRYWVYTPAPVLVVLGLAIWAIDFVELAVARNPILNLAILSIIGAGVAVALVALFSMQKEASALDKFMRVFDETKDLDQATEAVEKTHTDIAAVFRFVQKSGGTLDGPMAQRALGEELAHLRENYHARLSLPTFLSGFMIALGLFGTFIGLLDTLQSTGSLISNFGVGSADATASVSKLVKGMQGPLSGMATSFSASLFGLLGSLVLGAMLNSLQALGHKIQTVLKHLLDDLVIRASETASSGAGGGAVATSGFTSSLTPEFLSDFIEKMARQHQEAVEIFYQSQKSDLAVVEKLSHISNQMEAQAQGMGQILDSQSLLNQALSTQVETVEYLKSAVERQNEALTAVQKSHDGLLDIGERMAGATDDVRRIVSDVGEAQRRILASEKRSSEIYETLMAGIHALGERDAVLRDMQRSAIDAVKHASQIGVRINETVALGQQSKEQVAEAIDHAMHRFAEFKREQADGLQSVSLALRDLVRDIEERNSALTNLAKEQQADASVSRKLLVKVVEDMANYKSNSSVNLDALNTWLVDELRSAKASVSREAPREPARFDAPDPKVVGGEG